MDHSVRLTAALRTTYYRGYPLMQDGLEIPCSLDVYMMSSTVLSRKLIQRYTELVENLYMEPPDDGCVGSFIETPVASTDFSIPSTSKGKGQRNDSKGKNQQKQKERKDFVTKNIRRLFGGSAIVKSSGPLNSKETKIIRIGWRKLNIYIFFHFRSASLLRVVLQRECQISLKRRKIHWIITCNLEFRKCEIKDCKWSKIHEKCGIKECEFWTKFAFFGFSFLVP